jgi:hypothetical protein
MSRSAESVLWRATMIVSSNRDTAKWLAMLDDALLAPSAVARFRNAA